MDKRYKMEFTCPETLAIKIKEYIEETATISDVKMVEIAK